MLRLISGPWREQFRELVGKTERSLLLASPFIKADEAERVSECLRRAGHTQPSLTVLTDFRADSILSSSLDIDALRIFSIRFEKSSIVSVPRLHAKVYVSDARRAVVTSANLTRAGFEENVEYGLLIDDSELASRISQDMESYARLGSPVPADVLDRLLKTEQKLRTRYADVLRSAKAELRKRFDATYRAAREEMIATQVGTRSATSVFSDAILYLLSTRPMSTVELHPRIQRLLPDLCDDSVELVINGEHFGKRWKHQVRNSQQALKRAGLIRLEGRLWRRS
jgi:hypothetical protein